MPPVAVFRNNLALLAWLFTGAWVSMVSVFTWLILRAPAEDYTPLQRSLIVAFLWLLVAGPDGADSVFYRCQVTLADGTVLELAEKRRTEPVQACADRFNTATGQVPAR